jgi:hypothetical protein
MSELEMSLDSLFMEGGETPQAPKGGDGQGHGHGKPKGGGRTLKRKATVKELTEAEERAKKLKEE